MSINGHTITHGSQTPDAIAIDKLALVCAKAMRAGQEDVELQRLVRQKIAGAPSDAEAQVLAWEKFCMSLPYRRESGEFLEAPIQTAKSGGDCDDLVLLFLAGCVSLGIPCEPELVCDQQGYPFHIRALVHLPPLNPTHTIPVDPVCWSEREWSMSGKQPSADGRAVRISSGQQESGGGVWLLLLGVAFGLTASKVKNLLAKS